MKKLLFLIMLWLPLQSLAQFSGIKFEEYIHNFGILSQENGQVFYEFEFTNYNRKAVEILSVESTCGCTIGVTKSKYVEPYEPSSIRVAYNPKNRPGHFIKSVTITFKTYEDTVKKFLNVKGYVLNEEGMEASNSDREIEYDIQIKSFQAEIFSGVDTAFFESNTFNTFINDITYVIDKQNFVNLDVVLDHRSDADQDFLERIKSKTVEHVIEALELRNYSKNQVGFDFELNPYPVLDGGAIGHLLIDPVSYGYPMLYESIITPIYKEEKSVDQMEAIPEYSSVIQMLSYVKMPVQSFKKPNKNQERWNQLIRTGRMHALENSDLELGLIAKVPTGAKGNKIYKHLEDLEEELKEAFMEEGIAEEIIKFRPAEVIEYYDSSKTEHPDTLIIGVYPPTGILSKGNKGNNLWKEDSLRFRKVENYPFQNLPVYHQTIKGKGRVDTTNREFKRVINLILRRIQEGHEITLWVESSASNIPTYNNFDNIYVAKLRADESIELIKDYVQNKGYDPKMLQFKDPIALVQGPEFNVRYYLHSFYYQFQYIRIIPIYETDYNIQEDHDLISYSVNFSFAEAEINPNTKVFQLFIAKLCKAISKQGYVKLIIEASSSNVPTKEKTNEIFSFLRAEDARKKIMQEVARRGIDPLRVIITEERNLVQGPKFTGKIENKEVYEEFQYIKIIPEVLIKKN